MFFIFIGGASASGKTSVAEHLLEQLNKQGVTSQKLNMDDYYKERPDHLSNDEFRMTTNFDTPSMFDLELLQTHIDALSKGEKITKPLFSFATNKHSGEEEIFPTEIIIVEGIFAQYFYQKNILPQLPALPVLSVNVSTDEYNDVVNRRIFRDMASRGRTKEAVITQERVYVGPGFFQYTASHATGSDVYVNNKKHSNVDEQQKELDKVTDEIITTYFARKEMSLVSSIPIARARKPDVHQVIAKSHCLAGNGEGGLFKGYFSGIFGEVAGVYQEPVVDEPPPNTLSFS